MRVIERDVGKQRQRSVENFYSPSLNLRIDVNYS